MKRFWNEGGILRSAFAQEVLTWLAGIAGLVLLLIAFLYPWFNQAML